MNDVRDVVSDKEPKTMAYNWAKCVYNLAKNAFNKAIKKVGDGQMQLVENNKFLFDYSAGLVPSFTALRVLHGLLSSVSLCHNVTRTPLLHALSTKIYCLYGVEIDTDQF